jgi:hypothetical protein
MGNDLDTDEGWQAGVNLAERCGDTIRISQNCRIAAIDMLPLYLPIGKGGVSTPTLSFSTDTALCILEGESACEHHRSTGDGGCCDLCDAWIRNPGGQSGWIEGIAGILEAWMVKYVFRIHPKLHFA